MGYYYLHPFKPQYFFPRQFKKYPEFLHFYKPYTLKGRISRWLFNNLWVYRLFFYRNDITTMIPLDEVLGILKGDPILAFNRGTTGPEQKLTALVVEGSDTYFIKYADKPLTCQLVANEHETLKLLSSVDFVPKVLNYFETKDRILLKTSFIQGTPFEHTDLTMEIVGMALQFSEILPLKSDSITEMKMVFSHGDFCPWNMFRVEDKIYVYDWEMAGFQILGYDLFTFIFQPVLLLEQNANFKLILEKNYKSIDFYFKKFGVRDWMDYLLQFSQQKMNIEQKKESTELYLGYKNLYFFLDNSKSIIGS